MELFRTFLESPWPFAAFIFSISLFFGSFLIASEVILEKMKISRRKAYWAGRKQSGNGRKTPTDYAADQLKKVSEVPFVARPLLNASEAKVFDTLNKAVNARNPQWLVMAQVCVGEFLASADKDAFMAVNSKRVDFALMDANCCVRHAIEYQGSGHNTGTTAHHQARDQDGAGRCGARILASATALSKRPGPAPDNCAVVMPDPRVTREPEFNQWERVRA
jgi:hypothetical protein